VTREAGAGKRIASLIVYYRISSNTARAICHFVRRGADARIVNRRAAYVAHASPRRRRGLNFVKDTRSIEINRYTQRKEYRFNQSSA
jgi:hypothetical protein